MSKSTRNDGKPWMAADLKQLAVQNTPTRVVGRTPGQCRAKPPARAFSSSRLTRRPTTVGRNKPASGRMFAAGTSPPKEEAFRGPSEFRCAWKRVVHRPLFFLSCCDLMGDKTSGNLPQGDFPSNSSHARHPKTLRRATAAVGGAAAAGAAAVAFYQFGAVGRLAGGLP